MEGESPTGACTEALLEWGGALCPVDIQEVLDALFATLSAVYIQYHATPGMLRYGQRIIFRINVFPPKNNMESKHDGFQEESPFQWIYFQVPC